MTSKTPTRTTARLPERSEAVSGKESEGVTPIKAAQSKATKIKIAKEANAKPEAPKKRR